jgi:hypothetical protein
MLLFIDKILPVIFCQFKIRYKLNGICGAGLFTETTVDTTVSHMIGLMEMKNGNLRRHPTGFDQVGILKSTSRTETGRTDIPATITFDTLSKLFHPILKTLILW